MSVSETPEQWKARMGVGERSLVGQVVGGDGTKRTTRVPREDRPGVAGTITDHWDGRRDACARPETVHIRRNTPNPGG